MATISVSLPSDGQTIDVADYNTPVTTIVNEINGNLDNNNLAAAAAIAGSKIADAAITPAKWTNPYKFRATRQAAAVVGNGTFVKIVFDTEQFDTNNNFATGTYTIPANGYYQFNSAISIASASNDMVVSIYKNGTEYTRGVRMKGAASVASGGVSDLIQCTAGDTIEIWALGANNPLDLAASNNYFSGFLVSVT